MNHYMCSLIRLYFIADLNFVLDQKFPFSWYAEYVIKMLFEIVHISKTW